MRKTFGLCLALAAFAAAPVAHAGSHSHGADFFDRDGDNIWLLGPDAVPFCIEAANDFGQTPDELRRLVEESVGAWADFFKAQGLDRAAYQHPDVRGRGIALNWEWRARCVGDADEVTFAFGTTPAAVVPFLDGTSFGGLGMAIRGTYDSKSYRNGGLVWIAKDRGWGATRRRQLKHLLLHELGHVFGMQHGSVHVMDEKVAQRLSTTWNLGQIEAPNWPYDATDARGVELTDEGPSGTQCAWLDPSTRKPTRRGMFAKAALPFAADLGFADRDCLAVNLRAKAGAQGRPAAWYLDVTDLHTGAVTTVSGTAKPLLPERGPSLYLRIIRNFIDVRLPSHAVQALQPRSFLLPAQGIFVLPNGKTVGATLTFADGPKLEVFSADNGGWWSMLYERDRFNVIDDITYFADNPGKP